MDSNIYEQIMGQVAKSKNILLLTHAKADADGLGAMLSMYSALKDMGKEVTAATNDPAPDDLKFLPLLETVQNTLGASNDFVINVSTASAQASKIKYNVTDNNVSIVITPKEGTFLPEHVTFSKGTAQFDLIITFDTGNLEHLGPLYDQNAEMFYETPLINIDHHASNTDYGQINLVDVVASSATEVLFGLLKYMEEKQGKTIVNDDLATLLLAGIITDTGSFQHSNTSPRAMEVAAELLDRGARQQEIIKNIYKTKQLSTLKLWGTALSKVQVDPVYRMVWSTISKQDLQEAGAKSEETGTFIDDLLATAPGAEMIFLIKENDDGMISTSMRSTTNSVDVGKFSTEMGGGGHIRAAGFKVRDGRRFEEVVAEVVKKARQYQGTRLNIQPGDVPAPVVQAPAAEAPQAPETLAEPQGQRVETPLEFKAPATSKAQEENAQNSQPKKDNQPQQNNNNKKRDSRNADGKNKNQERQSRQPEKKQDIPPKKEAAEMTKEALKVEAKPVEQQAQAPAAPVQEASQVPDTPVEPAQPQAPQQTEQRPPDVPEWLKPE